MSYVGLPHLAFDRSVDPLTQTDDSAVRWLLTFSILCRRLHGLKWLLGPSRQRRVHEGIVGGVPLVASSAVPRHLGALLWSDSIDEGLSYAWLRVHVHEASSLVLLSQPVLLSDVATPHRRVVQVRLALAARHTSVSL